MSKIIAIKGALQSSTESLCEIKDLLVRKPGVDFTRHRKIDFETLIRIMLGWGAGTLRKELAEYFEYELKTPTPSALIEQREKLLPDALLHLFYDMNQKYPCRKLYKGLHPYTGMRRYISADCTGS